MSWPYVQAAIIQKVLSYTKTLAGRSNLKAVVIAEDTEDGTMRTTVAALTDAGMAASLVSAKSFADQSAGASVAFIGPGAGPGLASTVTSRQMLSFTTDIEAVRAGHVAVAVYVGPDRRPTIAINIGKAKAEGHSFAAEFLAAVEVIR